MQLDVSRLTQVTRYLQGAPPVVLIMPKELFGDHLVVVNAKYLSFYLPTIAFLGIMPSRNSPLRFSV